MDLVDPKRDFLLTLNESAQSRIAACIPSPPHPPPPFTSKKNWGGLRGERRPRSLHNRCYCYFFFFCRRGALGDAQTRHTSATRQKPKYGCGAQKFLWKHMLQEWRLSRNAPVRCAVSLCSRTSKHIWSPRTLLGWTIGHLRKSFGVKSSQISTWHITWLCLSNRGTTNASSPRCRCSKREIGGQLTLVATRNSIWVACVWQILIIMLQNLVSLRRIYSLKASPSVRWFYGFPSQELEVANYKKSNEAFHFYPLILRGTSCVCDCHA